MNVDSLTTGVVARGAEEAPLNGNGATAAASEQKHSQEAPIKLRCGRWRVLPEAGKEVRIKVETTTKRHGVLTVDFALLVTEPRKFAVFEFEGGGDAVGLERIKLPEDLSDLILQRLLKEGVAVLLGFCESAGMWELINGYDRFYCDITPFTSFAFSQALAEQFRLSRIGQSLHVLQGLESSALVDVANAFNKTMLSVQVMAEVFRLSAESLVFLRIGNVDALKQKTEAVVETLRRCRDVVRWALTMLKSDICGFDF